MSTPEADVKPDRNVTHVRYWTASISRRHSMQEDRVRPVTAPSAERIRQLIADLDNERFAVREKATGELEHLGELAEAA